MPSAGEISMNNHSVYTVAAEDESNVFTARPRASESDNGTRFSRPPSNKMNGRQRWHNQTGNTSTQTPPSRADLKGTNRESPEAVSEIEDFSSDIDMSEGDGSASSEEYCTLKQVKTSPTLSTTVSTTATSYCPAIVDQRPAQSYPLSMLPSGSENAAVTRNRLARGHSSPRTPVYFQPEAFQVQRGQGKDGPRITESPVQPQGGGIFSMIKSAVMGTVIPWEGPTELYDRLSAEYQRVSAELNHFKSECHDLRNKIQQDRVQYITLENELSHVRRELADSRHLADARGKELFGAQVFLSTTDILSVSEIAQKAAELNDEIFQAAALLAESLIHEVSNWAPQDEQNKSLTVALGMLGGPIVDAITSSSGPEINPYLIQLVLQISLTRFCGDKLGKWYEKDEITNEVLVNIYKEIFRTEEQAVSGRWRAITHAKTRLKTDNWAFELNNNLTHILRVASLLSPTVSDSLSTFEQKLSPIFRAIINLHIALGEQFTSADITPVVVTSGAAFEAEWMEDALSDARTSGRGNFKVNSVPLETADVVAATLGIGLRQRMPHPALKGSGNLGHVIILPPKVILQSTLTEILEPFV